MQVSDLVGTWSLISFEAANDAGNKVLPLGDKLRGFLTYTAAGYMSAVFSSGERFRFASPDSRMGSGDEIRHAFLTFDAYAGQYSFDSETSTVTHFAEVARFPNWEGTKLMRTAKLEAKLLTLVTPQMIVHGQQWISTLTWTRLD